MKKALVIAAFLSGTNCGWLPNIFQKQTDIGPYGEEIVHDKNIDIYNKDDIKNSEIVDLQQLRQQLQDVGNNPSTHLSQDNQQRPVVKAPKLDLDNEEGYIKELREEAAQLNDEFLANSEFQFAEYIGLTMIQKVFDKSLEQPEFVDLFENDAPYQQQLDTKLLITYELVEKKIEKFRERHREEESKMLDKLLIKFTGMLKDKAKHNKGFPDTEAMRTALFGQLAFRYEQEI